MKKRFLKAFRKAAWKYKHPILWLIFHSEKPMYFSYTDCSICKIIGEFGIWRLNCKPCPMAAADEKFGCIKFRSYNDARYLENKKAFLHRADILLRMVEIMENWPAERFTIDGWIYSGEELPREW